jgi:hypothetical protein
MAIKYGKELQASIASLHPAFLVGLTGDNAKVTMDTIGRKDVESSD